jgi:hypothetical protein
MKITKHISFYYLECRIKYINRIIEETNNYKYETDIFIHTNNKDLCENNFINYKNGLINIIFHDLSNINPYYLTWKCRNLLYKQRNDYDIFMYIEDDILVPNKAIEYWKKYNEKLIELNYNLGFLRIELDNSNEEYITDLYGVKFNKNIILDNDIYCVNDKNPYCAFWIYNKKEFNRFVESKYYDINNIKGPCIREKSAYGLINSKWYIETIIPIIDNKLIEDCKIYHMANNYVNDKSNLFATIKFNDIIINK